MKYQKRDLVRILDVLDQPRWMKKYANKLGLIVDVRALSIGAIYFVLIDEKIIDCHSLDLELVSRVT